MRLIEQNIHTTNSQQTCLRRGKVLKPNYLEQGGGGAHL